MNKIIKATLAVLSAIVIAGQAQAQEGGRPFNVALTGAAERPGSGDSDGSGTAKLRVNAGQRQVCYTITVSGIEPVMSAHIHRAPPTAAGPVVVPLAPPTTGCTTVTRELAQEIIKTPGAFYVNVHNQPFPGGALRGQLGR